MGVGTGVPGFGIGAWDLELEFEVQGLGFMFHISWFRIQDVRSKAELLNRSTTQESLRGVPYYLYIDVPGLPCKL